MVQSTPAAERAFVPDSEEEEEEGRQLFPMIGPPMLTASGDGTLKFWDVKYSEQPVSTYVGHDAGVLALSVDWERNRAISASQDHTIRHWDLDQEQEEKRLEGHGDVVSGIKVDWLARRALSCSYDGSLRTWDLLGECQRVVEGAHRGPVCCLDVAWGRSMALSGGGSGGAYEIKVWDIETGVSTGILAGHTGPVWSVCLDAGGTQALSGAADRFVKLWDLRTCQCERTMLKHTGPVGPVAASWEAMQAVSGSSDKSIIHWDLSTGEVLRRFQKRSKGHSGSIWSLSVDWAGGRLASGAGPGDFRVCIWELKSGYFSKDICGHVGTVWALDVNWKVALDAEAAPDRRPPTPIKERRMTAKEKRKSAADAFRKDLMRVTKSGKKASKSPKRQ